MDEFCDWPNCACKDLDPAGCRLPWRGPAMAARRERELRQAVIDDYAARPSTPQYIHIVGYGEDHPDLKAIRELRAARRKRWLYKSAQAVLTGLLFAIGLFLACAVGFMTMWYLDAQAIEQAQQQQGMDQ